MCKTPHFERHCKKRRTYKTAEIILQCHKVLSLFCIDILFWCICMPGHVILGILVKFSGV